MLLGIRFLDWSGFLSRYSGRGFGLKAEGLGFLVRALEFIGVGVEGLSG